MPDWKAIDFYLPEMVHIVSQFFLGYYLFANFIFFILLALAFVAVRRSVRSLPFVESLRERADLIAPPISLIAPAYNECKTISQSVKSFLMLDYPTYEIIVVNDGSTDSTLEVLKEQFQLTPARRFYDDRVSKTEVEGFYSSKIYPNLFVIDKKNGGKADAINVGLGHSRYDLFCAVDSDSILEPDCLLRVILPFIEEPETTIAAGGTVRPVNGSEIEYGRVKRARFSKNPLVLAQIIEYLRAFLFGRLGWNVLNSTMIISGAFGVFKRELVIRAGGYLKGSVGEDMELVIRLRNYCTQNQIPHRVCFVPDPICWTEVPEKLKTLARQRDRWQRGLGESLLPHKKMFLNPRFGLVGLLAYPYFLIVEFLGPVIELLAYIFMLTGWGFGFISTDTLLLFLILDLMFGIFMSVAAVFIEENAFHKYPRLYQLFVLLGISLLEQIGYRHFNLFFRLKGLWNLARGKQSWGGMSREGFEGAIRP